jgi:hypothetical protein
MDVFHHNKKKIRNEQKNANEWEILQQARKKEGQKMWQR